MSCFSSVVGGVEEKNSKQFDKKFHERNRPLPVLVTDGIVQEFQITKNVIPEERKKRQKAREAKKIHLKELTHDLAVEARNRDRDAFDRIKDDRERIKREKQAQRAKEEMAKERNRAAYQRRVIERQKRQEWMVSAENPKNKVKLDWRMRSFHAKGRHLCRHGLRHNHVFLKTPFELMSSASGDPFGITDTIERISKWTFSCDHDVQKVHRNVEPKKCYVCGFMMTTQQYNKTCGCHSYLCARCRSSIYTYEHDGNSHDQSYDKHNNDMIIINDEPVFDYSKWLNEHINLQAPPEKLNSSKVSAGFSYAQAAQKPVTFEEQLAKQVASEPIAIPMEKLSLAEEAERALAREQAREGIAAFKQRLNIIPVKPQGGVVSATTGLVKATTNAAWEAVKAFKERVMEAIRNFLAENITKIFGKVFADHFFAFCKALMYAIEVLLDYLVVLNPVVIFELLSHYNNGLYMMGKFAALLSTLYVCEDSAVNKIRARMSDLQFTSDFELSKAHLLQGSYGVCNTIFKHYVYKCKTMDDIISLKHNNYSLLGKLGGLMDGVKGTAFMASALFKKKTEDIKERVDEKSLQAKRTLAQKYNNAKTKLKNTFCKPHETEEFKNTVIAFKNEAFIVDNEAGIFETIANMCDGFCDKLHEFFPKDLLGGAKSLASVLRDILPILSFVKLSTDLGGFATKIVNSIVNRLRSKFSDPRDWINHQISTKGNPIFECTSLTLAYATIVATGKPSETNSLRTRFYVKCAEANEYAKKENMLAPWLTFKMKLESSFNSPPKPVQRECEPTTLTLSGPAGIGKSTIWPIIAARAILTKEEIEKSKDTLLADIMAKTYTWSQDSEFQPGLSGAKCVLFDDFQQDKTKNSQALAVIQLVTNAPYPINSANITGHEIKGMFADPNVIVICTNLSAEMAAQQLADTDALKRRMDINFHVEKRYDPNNPDEKIATISNCTGYKEMIGVKVSLKEMTFIFNALHYEKRERFTQTKEMVNREITHIPLEALIVKDLIKGEETQGSSWQKDGAFQALADKYIKVRNQAGFLDSISIDEFLSLSESFLITGTIIAAPILVAHKMYEIMNEICSLGWFNKVGLKKKLRTMVKSILLAGTGLVAAYGAIKLLTKTSDAESGGTKTSSRKAIQPTTNQAGIADFESLNNIFKQATGYLMNKESGASLNCVFVRGTYIMTNRHFFIDYSEGKMISPGTEIVIGKATWSSDRTFKFDPSNLRKMVKEEPTGNPLEDVVLYKLDPKTFASSKDITSFFWNGIGSLKNEQVAKIDYLPHDRLGLRQNEFMMAAGKVTMDRAVTSRMEGKTMVLHDLAQADYPNREKSCGSLIRRGGQETPLLGIHAAVRTGHSDSFFCLVTKNMILNALDRKDDLPTDFDTTKIIPSDPQSSPPSYIPPKSSLVMIGETKYSFYQPTKTDIVPSMCHDAFEEPAITTPAPLSGYDKRLEPWLLEQGYNWYKHDDKDLMFRKSIFEGSVDNGKTFPSADLRWAASHMKDKMIRMRSASTVPQSVLSTFSEVLNGIGRIPGNTKMDMTTSMGYPFSGKKKADFFEYDINDMIVLKEEGKFIEGNFNEMIDQIKVGVIPFTPFQFTLKDERIKLKKLIPPKTRLFAAGSSYSYFIFRKYFYTTLMTIYHADPHLVPCMPSLDRLSLDWDHLMRYMSEAGNKGFDFDFKNFDRTLQYEVIYLAAETLLHGMKIPELTKNTLCSMIASPYVIAPNHGKSIVFQTRGYLMSGSLLTYTINCYANELMHMAAYKSIMEQARPQYVEIAAYNMFVRGIRGGDDTMSIVNDEISEYYNGKTVAQYLNKYGMEVTSPDKTADIAPLKNMLELSFLKNKTAIAPGGFYIPQPELDSLIESCRWMRINKHNRDGVIATQDNCASSLRGIFFYGKTKYNEVRNRLLQCCPAMILPSYADLSIIWTNYFKFPGSHADGATSVVQGVITDSVAEPNRWLTAAESRHEYMKMSEQINEIAKIEDQYEKIVKDFPETSLADPEPIIVTTVEEVIQVKNQAGGQNDQAGQNENMVKPDANIKGVGNMDPENIDEQDLGTKDKQDQKGVGVTIQDTSQVVHKNVIVGQKDIKSSNRNMESTINDMSWDLSKLVEKMTLVTNFAWSITQPQGTVIWSGKVPTDLFITPAQRTPVEVTRFLRFSSVQLKVLLKGSPFYSGQLLMAFGPMSAQTDIYRGTNTGGVVISVSEEEGAEFNIPFRYPVGYLESLEENIGEVRLIVLAPLRSGPSAINNITGSIYCSFKDMQYKVPEIVPSSFFQGPKFDKHDQIVPVKNQSGQVNYQDKGIGSNNTKQTAKKVNINEPLSGMQSTLLCAGEGTLSPVTPTHFVDGGSNMVEFYKRFREIGRFSIEETPPGRGREIQIPYSSFLDIMANPFANYYSFFRGSIEVQIISMARDQQLPNLTCRATFSMDTNNIPDPQKLESLPMRIEGHQYFDETSPAQLSLVWYNQNYIIDLTANLPGAVPALVLYFENFGPQTVQKQIFSIRAALSDDAHFGCFTGSGNGQPFTDIQFLGKSDFSSRAYDIPIPVTIQAGVVENIERVLDNLIPHDVIESVLGLSLDAPSITYQNYPIQNRIVPFGIGVNGVRYSEKLMSVSNNGTALPDRQCFGTDTNETDINNLMRNTKSLIRTLTWKDSQISGTLLAKIPLGPEANGTSIHDTIPAMFTYWQGGTRIMLNVSCTQQHRGQLMAVLLWGEDTPAFKDVTQSYYTTIDLSTGRLCVALDAPYLSPKPYHYVAQNVLSSAALTRPSYIALYVASPLRGSTAVDSTVEVLVYKSYLEDFNLQVFGSIGSLRPNLRNNKKRAT